MGFVSVCWRPTVCRVCGTGLRVLKRVLAPDMLCCREAGPTAVLSLW